LRRKSARFDDASADGSSLPEPIAEIAAVQSESEQSKEPHPLYPNRWSDGTQRPNVDGIARKYPKVDRDDAAVALVIAQSVDAIARDRGGRENLTMLQQRAIDHVVECDLLLQAWREYFREQKPYTRQGRMRTGYTAYLSTLDRWMRLAQIVGMERREKDVSIADWFAEAEAEEQSDEQHEDDEDGNNGNSGGDERDTGD
jgi:hypothetical protein